MDQPTTWERLEDDVLVLDVREQVIVRFSGPASDIAERLLRGDTLETPESDNRAELRITVAAALVDAGALEPTLIDAVPAHRMSRRAALVAGAAAGITVLALPIAAAASSVAGPAGSTSTTVAEFSPPAGDPVVSGFTADTTAQPGNGSVEVTGSDTAP